MGTLEFLRLRAANPEYGCYEIAKNDEMLKTEAHRDKLARQLGVGAQHVDIAFHMVDEIFGNDAEGHALKNGETTYTLEDDDLNPMIQASLLGIVANKEYFSEVLIVDTESAVASAKTALLAEARVRNFGKIMKSGLVIVNSCFDPEDLSDRQIHFADNLEAAVAELPFTPHPEKQEYWQFHTTDSLGIFRAILLPGLRDDAEYNAHLEPLDMVGIDELDGQLMRAA
jgi:hypothetical protein